MFSISRNGIITMTRGDTVKTPLYINRGTVLDPILYTLTDTDVVYFAIMEPNTLFENAIVKKVLKKSDFDFDNHYVRLTFNASDTECLVAGTYYYAAKLVRLESIQNEDGTYTTRQVVDTVIPNTKLYLVE